MPVYNVFALVIIIYLFYSAIVGIVAAFLFWLVYEKARTFGNIVLAWILSAVGTFVILMLLASAGIYFL